MGDVTHIYDTNGALKAHYIYDAWGNHKIATDVNGIGTLNPIRYRGYYYDEETGLYYLEARYYDSETGRFISQDSIDFIVPNQLTGLNLYAYCNNNPVMYSDPSGCIGILAMLAIGAVVGLVVGGVSSTVIQAAENDWNWDKVDARVVVVDAIFGAVDGALSVTGIGLAVSLVLNPVLSAAQTVTTALVTNDMSNIEQKVGVSMTMGLITSFLPGGYNGRTLSGVYETSVRKIAISKSAKKIAMYTAKKAAINKTIAKQTAIYIGSTFASNFGSFGVNVLLGV